MSTLTVGSGGTYATIQAAVNAASAGDTILVGAGTFAGATITKELTIIGQGSGAGGTTITTGASQNGFQLSGNVDATASDTSATVTIQGFKFTGNAVGVNVASTAVLNHLVIQNSDFAGNKTFGVGMGSGASGLGTIEITGSTFEQNGNGTRNGDGDIVLFGFTGNALLKNVTVSGGTNAVPTNANADTGIQISGFNPTTYDVTHPIGTVIFDNVNVSGSYAKVLVEIQGYTNLDGLEFLDTGTTISGHAGWGWALQIDPTAGQTSSAQAGVAGQPGFFDDSAASALAPDTVDLSHVTVSNDIPVNVPSGSSLYAFNGMALGTVFSGTTVADHVTGAAGTNLIAGSNGNDIITGGTGDDVLEGGGGNDTIDGGAGSNTVVFSGNRADYLVSLNGSTYTVSDQNSGADGIDTVSNVATFEFADGAFSASDVVCFMPGTRIAVPDGTVPIEALKIGDHVATVDGRLMPVRWIGRQTVSRRFADPLRVLPVRIRAGALGQNVPARDLLISPDHAILVDDILVQAAGLVNGMSIIRESNVPMTYVYYHVELDDHSLILAENVPAETFVDNVDRLGFDNWDEHEALYPSGKSIPEMPLPRVKSRRQLPKTIRARLHQIGLVHPSHIKVFAA